MPWNSLENSVEQQNLVCITEVRDNKNDLERKAEDIFKGTAASSIIDILGVTTGHIILGKIQRITILWFQEADSEWEV